MYDYGSANQRFYGQPTAPLYAPTNISCNADGTGACNLALFYGSKDKLGGTCPYKLVHLAKDLTHLQTLLMFKTCLEC